MSETRSLTDSIASDLFDRLCDSLDARFAEEGPSAILSAWAAQTPIILDGQPFTFERHEYLREPYQDDHPHITEMKATQMGLSTKAMLKAMHGARYRGYKGILYLFPSRTDVLDFSKGRVAPLIEENQESIGRWVRDINSAGLKRIWGAAFYLRGMHSRISLKGIPVDFIVFDELDEAPQNMVSMALKRMSHSEFKEVLKLSNPTLPDYGIDAAFQETDQRYWLIKCDHCGHWSNMVETFPDCLLELGDRVIRACERCRREINPSNGQWVAKYPDVTEKRGYQYSQLFSHFVNPAEILHDFRTAKDLTNLYNLTIGIPWVEAVNRLSVQEVLALCGNEGIAGEDRGPCFMGVDQGKDFHVVIGKRHPSMAGRIVYVGIHKEWEELDRLMKAFNVSRCVVDAQPKIGDARDFAKRHPGRVFLNFYQEHQKGAYKWNEQDLTVACNRTESLDASHNEIQNGRLVLPKDCVIVREFAQHLHNVAKRLEEDLETGSKRYVYVKLGEDHFRHAFNYEAIARQAGSGLLFPEF